MVGLEWPSVSRGTESDGQTFHTVVAAPRSHDDIGAAKIELTARGQLVAGAALHAREHAILQLVGKAAAVESHALIDAHTIQAARQCRQSR